ncbi:MAG: thiamine diphosphokinase [Gammaproteobacteria bacterium]|nr:thiamine diphosphokinase [Gammaproteobacteria bacterium]
MKRAWVFAGGAFAPEHLSESYSSEDLVVCVDSGLSHCLASGLQPSLLVGDFDSVDKSLLETISGVDIDQHSPRKNQSDLELALVQLQQQAVDEIVLLGVSGGRTDHLLFNWFLPQRYLGQARIRILDGTVDARLVSSKHPFSAHMASGLTVSLFPLNKVAGIVTHGLEYPLSNASMDPGTTLGLSNVSIGGEVSVTVTSGLLWLLEVVAEANP